MVKFYGILIIVKLQLYLTEVALYVLANNGKIQELPTSRKRTQIQSITKKIPTPPLAITVYILRNKRLN